VTTFERCVDFVLKQEGGYVNDPQDSGGETKFGISKKAFPHLDIAHLTIEQAREIYRRHYWDTVRGDELPPGVALMVFDLAVNAGVHRSVCLLQRACGVEEDGILGPVTMQAAQAVDPMALCAVRVEFYRSLPKYPIFGHGWIRRSNDSVIAARALQLVSA
jgi:lysozyme family protein